MILAAISNKQMDIVELKILIVDDSMPMRNLIEAILKSYGCKNVILSSGVTQALESVEKQSVDLAIVDWFMAPLDGLEFVRRIRTGSSNPCLPIIMLTGHAEAKLVQLMLWTAPSTGI